MSRFNIDMNISNAIKSVSADSFKDSIKMIEIEKIKPCQDNFYEMSEIEILADDIERQGLKHNLVVSVDKDNENEYWLKSGHRRLTAIQLLINENRLSSKYVPCLIDGTKSKAETMLDLIMLNATTRVLSDGDIMKQYEVLKKTYEELENEGKKFTGRMRERIADALQVSPSQVGKIENINNNATAEVKQAIDDGKISISLANEISKLEIEKQKELLDKNNSKKISHKNVQEILKKTENNSIKDSERIENNSEKASSKNPQKVEIKSEKISKVFLTKDEIEIIKFCLEVELENSSDDEELIKGVIKKLK